MQCIKCFAVRSEGYEYPEEYCGAYVPEEKMVEFANGQCGCLFPSKAIKARLKKVNEAISKQYQFIEEWNREYEYREEKGIDVRSDKEPFLEEAKHCIGMDYKKPYTRHGKKFYRPYRNYFNTHSRDKVWSILEDIGYAEEYTTEFFRLTEAGIDWLSNCIGVIIR